MNDTLAALHAAINGAPTDRTVVPRSTALLFPDALVGAMADGLNADKLVRLELPAARITPAGRADLTRRFGGRVVLV